jgi:hypothetical protein
LETLPKKAAMPARPRAPVTIRSARSSSALSRIVAEIRRSFATRPRVSETLHEAILTAITVPASAGAPNGRPVTAAAAERVAVHAVALRALLTEAPSVLSPAERHLLSDWLDRLATARNQT